MGVREVSLAVPRGGLRRKRRPGTMEPMTASGVTQLADRSMSYDAIGATRPESEQWTRRSRATATSSG
jgi:hypothetical protein